MYRKNPTIRLSVFLLFPILEFPKFQQGTKVRIHGKKFNLKHNFHGFNSTVSWLGVIRGSAPLLDVINPIYTLRSRLFTRSHFVANFAVFENY